MVIGNDPSGRKPWTGKILGLAIYNHTLSPEKVIEHFEKWRSESTLSLLKEKDIVALYSMNEQNGKVIHNVLNDRYNLVSDTREIQNLKKEFS